MNKIDIIKNALDQVFSSSDAKKSGIAIISDNNNTHYFINDPNLSSNQITSESLFYIGSLSKQFTAVALLKTLSEKYGEDNVEALLHRPLSNFLTPEHKIWNNDMPDWANKVTLHQLLTHSSGIHDYTNMPNIEYEFFSKAFENYEIISLVKDMELEFVPGSACEYSNTNFYLLAEVIEQLSGKSYTEVLDDLFNQVGMQNSYSIDKGNYLDLKQEAKFEKLTEEIVLDEKGNITEIPAYFDLKNTKGTGNLISNIDDLNLWNIQLHNNKTILSDKLYDLFTGKYMCEDDMWTGYGIGMIDTSYGEILGHTGKLDSYHTIMLYFKDLGISVIVLSNMENDDFYLVNEAIEKIISDGELYVDSNNGIFVENEIVLDINVELKFSGDMEDFIENAT